MAAGTRVLCFLIICSLVCSSRDQKNITADLGQDAILPCKAPNKDNINIIRAVKWSRPDQDPDYYVLYYRNPHFDPDNQHPSYQNRVDLQNKEMKAGNVSLILMNVTMEDRGTYECWVFQRGKYEHISITYLEVVEPGEKFEGAKGDIIGDEGNKTGGDQVGISRGHFGIVAVIFPFLTVFASLCFLMYKRHKRQNSNLLVPPDEVV